jgi:hypothetical protein
LDDEAAVCAPEISRGCEAAEWRFFFGADLGRPIGLRVADRLSPDVSRRTRDMECPRVARAQRCATLSGSGVELPFPPVIELGPDLPVTARATALSSPASLCRLHGGAKARPQSAGHGSPALRRRLARSARVARAHALEHYGSDRRSGHSGDGLVDPPARAGECSVLGQLFDLLCQKPPVRFRGCEVGRAYVGGPRCFSSPEPTQR